MSSSLSLAFDSSQRQKRERRGEGRVCSLVKAGMRYWNKHEGWTEQQEWLRQYVTGFTQKARDTKAYLSSKNGKSAYETFIFWRTAAQTSNRSCFALDTLQGSVQSCDRLECSGLISAGPMGAAKHPVLLFGGVVNPTEHSNWNAETGLGPLLPAELRRHRWWLVGSTPVPAELSQFSGITLIPVQ